MTNNAAPPLAPSVADPKPPARRTVLVVDDDPDALLVMRAALRKAGYEVRTAASGEAALERFAAEPADMVMLDVEMPGISGHETCARLRETAGPLLPIVMVTGMDDVGSVQAAYDSGATDFISKPVNWALLGHRVRYLFRGHQAVLDLRAAEARTAAILDAIPDLLFEVDIDGLLIDFRAPDPSLLAIEPARLIGCRVAEVLPPEPAGVILGALRQALQHGSSSGAQYSLALPRGLTWFELSVTRKPALAREEKPRFVILARDVTERKAAEAQIAQMAFFDSLTGLPNRRSFLDRVNREIVRAAHHGDRLAVLFIDLDGFKTVNDTMGHASGDLLLKAAAERLHDGLRPSDLLSRPLRREAAAEVPAGTPGGALARLGGDEFTALVLDIERPEDAVAVAERLATTMRRPFLIEGREVSVTASVGIALYPEDGRDGATLLEHADTAMYHAKTSGRNNAQMYSTELTERIVRRMALENDLRGALERGQFRLVYQPQIDLASGEVRTVEALIRWQHPVRGLVPPTEFIAVAEENGLITPIGRWVLRTACADAARWNAAGHAVHLAVNVSPLQLAMPGLLHDVLAEADAHGLARDRLELEITEGLLMEGSAHLRAALEDLRRHGVRIALDDFGTGYSSLAYLTRLPIGNIKIDRSFVASMLGSGESAVIVRTIIALAESLGLRVTAEGVETLEQARALEASGCALQQGYYFSRPVPAQEIAALLARRWELPALRGSAGNAFSDTLVIVD